MTVVLRVFGTETSFFTFNPDTGDAHLRPRSQRTQRWVGVGVRVGSAMVAVWVDAAETYFQVNDRRMALESRAMRLESEWSIIGRRHTIVVDGEQVSIVEPSFAALRSLFLEPLDSVFHFWTWLRESIPKLIAGEIRQLWWRLATGPLSEAERRSFAALAVSHGRFDLQPLIESMGTFQLSEAHHRGLQEFIDSVSRASSVSEVDREFLSSMRAAVTAARLRRL